jgi:hypothetical protein
MFTLPFVIVVTGLLVTGYSLIFSGSSFARASGAWAVAIAGVIVGGLVTAHLNGGKPYGFDVPFGIERWKQDLPPAQPYAPPIRRDREPAIA